MIKPIEQEIASLVAAIRAIKPSHPVKLAVASVAATAQLPEYQEDARDVLKLLHRHATKEKKGSD